ncbi:hypothetical protein J2755_001254 [Methanohalophilus levihalophilus]|uniref:DUF4391 domain-containing protein n=1 Tax=Methanohalophilus levihalophilus TaxID=1431282 RepID=UPI001AE2E2A4|nr:DUF4391 domain-containing protein [Methanohalophilus levihalophilus]MBP2030320.1 hypothetical protein [Methanohalophilus levihalophilus]
MSVLYDFPEQAKFGRVLSKSKIYEHANPTSRVKDMFVKEVEKITWTHKLSSSTINLPVSDEVTEIQIFTIILRTETISEEVLRTIDKAIPSPIIFHLDYRKRSRYMAAYKRPSEADRSKWVVSSYFETEWMDDNSEKTSLPVVLNMGALYQALIKDIVSLPFRKSETLEELVKRMDELRTKEREAAKIESRIKKEKQFNRRVELNSSLNELKQEIQDLKC